MNENVQKIKERMYRNRLQLARQAAVTAIVVAAYYIGKDRGTHTVHIHPTIVRNEPIIKTD